MAVWRSPLVQALRWGGFVEGDDSKAQSLLFSGAHTRKLHTPTPQGTLLVVGVGTGVHDAKIKTLSSSPLTNHQVAVAPRFFLGVHVFGGLTGATKRNTEALLIFLGGASKEGLTHVEPNIF